MRQGAFIFAIAWVLISNGYSKEVFINTLSGKEYLLEVDEETTIKNLTDQLKAFSEDEQVTSIIMEVPLKEEGKFELIRWKAKRHGQFLGYPRMYYRDLSSEERQDIRYIITTLANKSPLSILGHKNSLEQAGDRIDHIHPLKFLVTVFTDEELKVGIRNIRGKGLIWGDFIGGIKESLSTEHGISNMRDEYITDFASRLELDIQLIYTSIQERRWDEFIDTLITKIPRKGEHSRYDS